MTLRRWFLYLLLAPAVVCAQTHAPAGQSKKQTPKQTQARPYVARWDAQDSGVTDNLCSVFFLDAQTGWAAGENNTVLKTTDGGVTWRRLTERTEAGRCAEITFSDANNGWLNTGDLLLYTSDGGDTWRPAATLEQSGGFGVGCNVGPARYQVYLMHVYRSDDGGRTWTALPGNLEHNNYRAISFSDDQHGWLLAQPNAISMTTDGGRTWSDVEQKISARHLKVMFVDAVTGWAFGPDGTTMLGSADGGKTWTSQYTGLASYDALGDMDFRDTKNGFVLSGNGQVIATTDGGKHWRQIGKLVLGINGLSFPDPSHGWVVGDKGYIRHYHLVKAEGRGGPGKP